MVFEGFFERNEGFGKVKKWVLNLIKGILMKWKGRKNEIVSFSWEMEK